MITLDTAGGILDDQTIKRIEPDVLARVASTPRHTQRWLKTALQTIRTMPTAGEEQAEVLPLPRRESPPDEEIAPDLDDMITGKADLKEQLKAHPELAEELEGLSEIIDMLRDVGKQRREMGEDSLRERLLRDAEDEQPDEDVWGGA